MMKSVTMADAEAVQRVCIRTFRLFAALCFILLVLATYTVAQSGKRLILKDGTWQGITQYEIQGDRARYLSSQRGEWEELPKALVDWKATEEWNAGLKKEKATDLRDYDAEDADDKAGHTAEAANALTIAPGLKLPLTGGVFMLNTLAGQPSLDELTQSESKVSNDLRAALNRKAYFKQKFELRKPHARVHAHVPAPEFFVNIDLDDAPQVALTDRFRILRLESDRDARVLASVEVSVLGKQNQTQQYISTHVENLSNGWLKIVPLEGLEPGEYALVEMLLPNEFNSYVWDFAVDADAPANPDARKAESAAGDNNSNVSPDLKPPSK
jgi:hypothetical protein